MSGTSLKIWVPDPRLRDNVIARVGLETRVYVAAKRRARCSAIAAPNSPNVALEC